MSMMGVQMFRYDCVSDCFGGIAFSIEEGELTLKTADLVRVLDLSLSDVLVPLDQIARAEGCIDAVESDVDMALGLLTMSTSKNKEGFRDWLNKVALPFRDSVRAFDEQQKVKACLGLGS